MQSWLIYPWSSRPHTPGMKQRCVMGTEPMSHHLEGWQHRLLIWLGSLAVRMPSIIAGIPRALHAIATAGVSPATTIMLVFVISKTKERGEQNPQLILTGIVKNLWVLHPFQSKGPWSVVIWLDPGGKFDPGSGWLHELYDYLTRSHRRSRSRRQGSRPSPCSDHCWWAPLLRAKVEIRFNILMDSNASIPHPCSTLFSHSVVAHQMHDEGATTVTTQFCWTASGKRRRGIVSDEVWRRGCYIGVDGFHSTSGQLNSPPFLGRVCHVSSPSLDCAWNMRRGTMFAQYVSSAERWQNRQGTLFIL